MNIFKLILLIISIMITPFFIMAQSSIKTGDLRCEYLVNPIGIALDQPRLSWKLTSTKKDSYDLSQSGYSLILSDNLDDIKKKKGNLWETGSVHSDQNLHILYQGKPLESFKKYYWSVKVFDQNGKDSKWSEPQFFETGLLKQQEWAGKWIGDGKKQFENDADFYENDPMPLFRKGFDIEKPIRSAKLYLTGLGYYEAYLNGKRIGDHVLDPGWTAYRKEVLYAVYDIEALLKNGSNTIGVMLGNGWYNPLPLKMWGQRNLRDRITNGRPVLNGMIRIEYKDGSTTVIPTDQSWKTTSGPIMKNNIYIGEHYDARAEVPHWNTNNTDHSIWTPASLAKGPTGKFVLQMQPAIKITRIIKPVAIIETKPGVFVVDMGQNFAGVARLKVRGAVGTKITARFGEDIYSDGNVNFMTSVAGQVKHGNGGSGAPEIALQEDSYTLKGIGLEIWQPSFTFHGYRYIEIQGWPGSPTINDIEGLRMNADVTEVGKFESSNAMFNQLESNIRWTFLSNLFSVQSDCPAREKYGYGGDMFCSIESFMYRYDMELFYKKVLRDFVNDQRELGGITETMPHVGIADSSPGDMSGPLGFQIGFPYLVKKLYDFYGDKSLITEHYVNLKKQINFLKGASNNYLSNKDLGDHESINPRSIPFTASVFYYLHVKLMRDFADIIGKNEDSKSFTHLMDTIQKAINKEFYNPEDGSYEEGSQSTQLFALWTGITHKGSEDKVISKLMSAFEQNNWHLSTGIFGTKMLFDVLRNSDTPELAYTIANQSEYPGWGHMIEKGATTLWETWAESDNVYSKNHPMFGSVGEWFYRSLLGINGTSPGFKTFKIQVQPGELTEAKGSFRSPYGEIKTAWQISENGFQQFIEVPVNTSSELWLPLTYGNKIAINGKPLEKTVYSKTMEEHHKHTVIKLGSGSYQVQITK